MPRFLPYTKNLTSQCMAKARPSYNPSESSPPVTDIQAALYSLDDSRLVVRFDSLAAPEFYFILYLPFHMSTAFRVEKCNLSHKPVTSASDRFKMDFACHAVFNGPEDVRFHIVFNGDNCDEPGALVGEVSVVATKCDNGPDPSTQCAPGP